MLLVRASTEEDLNERTDGRMTAAAASASDVSHALKAERDRFVALAFCWADLLIELDENQQVVFAAGAVQPVLGLPIDQVVGLSVVDLVAARDQPLVGQLLKVAKRQGRIENVTIRLQGAHGATAPMAFAGYCLEDLRGHYFLAMRAGLNPILKDPAEAAAAQQRFTRDTDSGLFDSSSFSSMASARLAGGQAGREDANLTLIALPGFETLRGRLGPEAEKDFLNTVGACLRANSLHGDSAGRVAPDRYGLVHDKALDVAELEEQIAEFTRSFDPDGVGVEVEAATVTIDRANVTEENLAKGLVYTINRFRDAKGTEFSLKNLSTNISALVGQAVDTVNAFKRLVAAGDFDVAFQPVIDVMTGEIHHYEALARFGGKADESPYRHITFAEETGLIPEFDVAMAAKVVGWLAQMPRSRNYRIAINMSGNSVGNLDYISRLIHLLRTNNWLEGRLLFEITESARVFDLQSVNKFVQTLRNAGYAVCLDDFGAGAASFQYLSALEVDVVKLDGSAIRNARSARKGKAFLKALTGLCRELGVSTIAEMVDDKAGLDFIRDCGVEYVQGYLFGRPSRDIRVFEASRPEELFPNWKGGKG
jgi:EAL domain-containing protein (putative c-di-GMP-specific phosphodiesterase class I)